MDPKLQTIIENEAKRQANELCMIPSENYSSKAVREAVGSVLMHKYSEGYPQARYYEGNQNIDDLESLAIERAKLVFNLPEDWYVNVQPLAGSNANLAVYLALLEPGDKILSMYLPDGGHLSHGWSYTPKELKMKNEKLNSEKLSEEELVYRGGTSKVNVVSKIFNVVQYKTNPETNLFDYDFIAKLALEEKPKLIVTGGTAYPRDIDYKRVREIADSVGAYYLADVAHEAGLIAAGALPSPVGIADIVTLTTHKTLRGPKGAMILCRGDLATQIDKSVFPGLQGGPHNGTIAGIAQVLFEAGQPEYNDYQHQIIKNAQALSTELAKLGFKIVTGGTDKHLVLIDSLASGIDGRKLARALACAGIIANKNTIPWEKGSPVAPSGVRLGTPFITTRGMKEAQMLQIASWIAKVRDIALKITGDKFVEFSQNCGQNKELAAIKAEAEELCRKFPLPE